MGIFTDTPELVDFSMRMMKILAVGYIAMAVTQVLSGVMRGAGDTVTPMWISLLITVGLRIPIAYGISYLPEVRYIERTARIRICITPCCLGYGFCYQQLLLCKGQMEREG